MAYSNTTYKSRSMRQRRGTDKWEIRLTHKNPMTNEIETSYHTIEAKTEAQAVHRRDELIRTLSFNGSAFASDETVQELLAEFIEHKRKSGGIEESTANYYEKDARSINRHIGGIRIADVTIAVVDNMLAEMAMTLNTYAEVDPEAKRAAVGRIQAAFDIDESEVFKLPSATPEPQYTVAQLEAMLAEARKREGLEDVA